MTKCRTRSLDGPYTAMLALKLFLKKKSSSSIFVFIYLFFSEGWVKNLLLHDFLSWTLKLSGNRICAWKAEVENEHWIENYLILHSSYQGPLTHIHKFQYHYFCIISIMNQNALRFLFCCSNCIDWIFFIISNIYDNEFWRLSENVHILYPYCIVSAYVILDYNFCEVLL